MHALRRHWPSGAVVQTGRWGPGGGECGRASEGAMGRLQLRQKLPFTVSCCHVCGRGC